MTATAVVTTSEVRNPLDGGNPLAGTGRRIGLPQNLDLCPTHMFENGYRSFREEVSGC